MATVNELIEMLQKVENKDINVVFENEDGYVHDFTSFNPNPSLCYDGQNCYEDIEEFRKYLQDILKCSDDDGDEAVEIRKLLESSDEELIKKFGCCVFRA